MFTEYWIRSAKDYSIINKPHHVHCGCYSFQRKTVYCFNIYEIFLSKDHTRIYKYWILFSGRKKRESEWPADEIEKKLEKDEMNEKKTHSQHGTLNRIIYRRFKLCLLTELDEIQYDLCVCQ